MHALSHHLLHAMKYSLFVGNCVINAIIFFNLCIIAWVIAWQYFHLHSLHSSSVVWRRLWWWCHFYHKCFYVEKSFRFVSVYDSNFMHAQSVEFFSICGTKKMCPIKNRCNLTHNNGDATRISILPILIFIVYHSINQMSLTCCCPLTIMIEKKIDKKKFHNLFFTSSSSRLWCN